MIGRKKKSKIFNLNIIIALRLKNKKTLQISSLRHCVNYSDEFYFDVLGYFG